MRWGKPTMYLSCKRMYGPFIWAAHFLGINTLTSLWDSGREAQQEAEVSCRSALLCHLQGHKSASLLRPPTSSTLVTVSQKFFDTAFLRLSCYCQRKGTTGVWSGTLATPSQVFLQPAPFPPQVPSILKREEANKLGSHLYLLRVFSCFSASGPSVSSYMWLKISTSLFSASSGSSLSRFIALRVLASQNLFTFFQDPKTCKQALFSISFSCLLLK